jgi:adenine-specific DNA-methyltransferase
MAPISRCGKCFFCGGEKGDFKKWRTKLDDQAGATAKKKLSKLCTLSWMETLGNASTASSRTPFPSAKRVVVRVISQFGEGSTWVLTL